VIHRGLLLLLPKQHTHTRSFGWIAIKIYNEIKGLKVPTYALTMKNGINLKKDKAQMSQNAENVS